MKIVLLKDVAKLGHRYDIKEVSSGYAQNRLIPQGLAVAATPAALREAETMKAKVEGERKLQEELLAKNLKDLENVTLEFTGKANEKGHLFAGLHREAIAELLEKQTKLKVLPAFIELDQPVKTVGEHDIEVKGTGKSVKFKLIVKSE